MPIGKNSYRDFVWTIYLTSDLTLRLNETMIFEVPVLGNSKTFFFEISFKLRSKNLQFQSRIFSKIKIIFF